jgi:hypothetical protein
MNRINPLQIIALLMMVFIFVFFKLSSEKQQLEDEKVHLTKMTQLCDELVSLKKVYGDKKRIRREIDKILRYSSIKNAKVQREYKKSGIHLYCESIELVPLNALMAKLLNGSFNITTLKIKRVDDKKAKLNVEIKW